MWPAVEWPEPTWLTGIVDALPVSVAESGVWLSNPTAAAALSGVPPAESAAEWQSWTAEQHEEYRIASDGAAITGIQLSMQQFNQEWEELFGFGAWAVRAMAETGENEWIGFETNVLTGQFDPAKIKDKLLELGYEARVHAGREYLSLPEGTRPEVKSPFVLLVNSYVRNVFTDGQMLLTAPTAERMQELLSVRAEKLPSLGRHPAFGDLAFTQSDALFSAILSRKAALEPEQPRMEEREPPADWETLGQWPAMAAAFHRPSPELKKITLALWYADLEQAQAAAGELAHRFQTYHPTELQPMTILQDRCGNHWIIETSSAPRGAVLSISCQLESGPPSHGLGTLLWNVLVDGTLPFLVS